MKNVTFYDIREKKVLYVPAEKVVKCVEKGKVVNYIFRTRLDDGRVLSRKVPKYVYDTLYDID